MDHLATTFQRHDTQVEITWYTSTPEPEAIGYMLAEKVDGACDTFRVKCSVANRGRGLEMYKLAMKSLNCYGIWLTCSDELNKGSARCWEKLAKDHQVHSTELGLETVLDPSEEYFQHIKSVGFMFNAHTVDEFDLFNTLIHRQYNPQAHAAGLQYYVKEQAERGQI
ncbi:hypothetical protein NVP1244A_138 [Vibrio phage 1.244.A._10N.261.54.C3]|nr:hypothetical protein NVP1244A_138 [Vibrio phage 1.244.A._10N.261.54.C3]AUR98766.1 hypothetical protein NVP1255O_138 [Vibrio phage 1.255.O._10N.286.45.F1]